MSGRMTLIVGIILIVFGALTLSYEGINYKSEENVAQVGDLKLSAEQNKHIHFNPWLSGGAIALGLIMVVVNRRKP